MAISARSSEFNLTFEGPALEDGRMAVADLAPALLALGEIFHEANSVIDPSRPPVALEVKAWATGSFEVILSLGQTQGIAQELIRALTGQDVQALSNLIVLVTASRVGVFAAIQFVSTHRPVRQERPEPGITRFVSADGQVLDVQTDVARLVDRPTIRRNVRKVVAPLAKDGIERLRIDSGTDDPLVVEASDEEAYEVASIEAQPISDHVAEMALAITVLTFTGARRWRFSDGNVTFAAEILDEDFLRRVETDEAAFRKGDLLRCLVHVSQWQTETGLKTSYEITKVIAHIPALSGLGLSVPHQEEGRESPRLTTRDPSPPPPSPESADKD